MLNRLTFGGHIKSCGAFLFVAGMDNGFSALDMDASDVYTEEFFQG